MKLAVPSWRSTRAPLNFFPVGQRTVQTHNVVVLSPSILLLSQDHLSISTPPRVIIAKEEIDNDIYTSGSHRSLQKKEEANLALI